MSRSGYVDDDEDGTLGLYRANVDRFRSRARLHLSASLPQPHLLPGFAAVGV